MEAVRPAADCPTGEGVSTACVELPAADDSAHSRHADALGHVLPAEARFERVFDRCGPGLYRFFVVRTSDRRLADDLMQQLAAQERPGGLELPEDRIEPWLRAIAKKLVHTHWRRIARRPAHVAVEDAERSA